MLIVRGVFAHLTILFIFAKLYGYSEADFAPWADPSYGLTQVMGWLSYEVKLILPSDGEN